MHPGARRTYDSKRRGLYWFHVAILVKPIVQEYRSYWENCWENDRKFKLRVLPLKVPLQYVVVVIPDNFAEDEIRQSVLIPDDGEVFQYYEIYIENKIGTARTGTLSLQAVRSQLFEYATRLSPKLVRNPGLNSVREFEEGWDEEASNYKKRSSGSRICRKLGRQVWFHTSPQRIKPSTRPIQLRRVANKCVQHTSSLKEKSALIEPCAYSVASWRSIYER